MLKPLLMLIAKNSVVDLNSAACQPTRLENLSTENDTTQSDLRYRCRTQATGVRPRIFESTPSMKSRPRWRLTLPTALSSTVDPFNSTPVRLTDEAKILMNYFSAAQSAGGNAYKLHLLPDYVQDAVRVNSVVWAAEDVYLQYEHCMYSMMAFMSVRLLVITKVRLNSLKEPEYYMKKAIMSLRRKLRECENSGLELDYATIGAMTQIALADWAAGNLLTARIHLKVLSTLVPYVDLEQPRGRHLIEAIRTLDLQVALEARKLPFLSAAPSFEPLSRTRISQIKGLLDLVAEKATCSRNQGCEELAIRLGRDPTPPADIMADCDITLDFRLGTKLEQALETGVLQPSIHPIIVDVLDCLTIAKLVWRTKQATAKDARWMCRTARTMVHCLWTYNCDQMGLYNDFRHHLTNCVRLALVIMLTLATNRMASRAVAVLGEELCMACQQVNISGNASDLEQQMYLWTLLTGLLVTSKGSYEHEWFLCEASTTSSGLGITTYELLHEVMTGFLYSWTMQMQSLQEVIRAIEYGSSRSPGARYDLI